MTAGENMTLSCTFQTRDSKRTKVLWLRGSGEDVVLDSNHPFYRGRLRVSRMDEHRQGKATLTLAELQEQDSGLYQCCIELDRGKTGMGGGTELRVMRRNQSATGESQGGREWSTGPVPLGVLAPLWPQGRGRAGSGSEEWDMGLAPSWSGDQEYLSDDHAGGGGWRGSVRFIWNDLPAI